MSAIETNEMRANLTEYTHALDYEDELPEYSWDEILTLRGLLAAANYIQSGTVSISRREGVDYSVRNLVYGFTGGNLERLRLLTQRDAVVGPYVAYDESGRQTLQGDGITIYTRRLNNE